MLKKNETQKIYYGEYLYKLTVVSPLANMFRGKRFASTRKELDKIKQAYNKKHDNYTVANAYSYRFYQVPRFAVYDAEIILGHLSIADIKSFKLRIEYNEIAIYSNNKEWLLDLTTKITPDTSKEFFEPNTKYLDELQKGFIVVSNELRDYNLKVTIKGFCPISFANWVKNNTDKIRVGFRLLSYFEKGFNVNGCYFYVRDEKVLSMIYLLISNHIVRVDKLVHKEESDK